MYCAFTRPRYQVGVTGPLVLWFLLLSGHAGQSPDRKKSNRETNSSDQCFSVLSTIAQVWRKMSLKILVS